ncbi:helix-turn-helix transcriptional regulator, partial [Fangia hongkongensis]
MREISANNLQRLMRFELSQQRKFLSIGSPLNEFGIELSSITYFNLQEKGIISLKNSEHDTKLSWDTELYQHFSFFSSLNSLPPYSFFRDRADDQFMLQRLGEEDKPSYVGLIIIKKSHTHIKMYGFSSTKIDYARLSFLIPTLETFIIHLESEYQDYLATLESKMIEDPFFTVLIDQLEHTANDFNQNIAKFGLKLTNMELKCLYYRLSQGLSSKEIATKLMISPATVNTHITNINQRLNLT